MAAKFDFHCRRVGNSLKRFKAHTTRRKRNKHSINTYHPLSPDYHLSPLCLCLCAFVCIGGCWRSSTLSTLLYSTLHLFSLSSCLPVPSWFCLSVFSDTLPWYRSWVHSMLHFLLVRKWDPAVRERGEGIRRKKQWKKAEIFTPVALCQWVEVREGQWNWILMHFCDIIQFRQ